MGTVDLNGLPVFASVAETGSFSEAAKRLGLPKSSVSRSIAALEAAMGVRLLHRTTRHVALSSAGAALLERVQPLLRGLDQAVGELPEREEQPSGLLRVTATIDFATAVLSELVARFCRLYPAIDLDLHLSNQVVDIVAEGFDVAFRIAVKPLRDSTLVAKRVAAVELALYAGPTYLAARGAPRTPADLDRHDWVRYRGMGKVRLEGPGETASVGGAGRILCDDMMFAHAAVRAGAGIGLLPSFLVGGDLDQGRLSRVLPRWNVPSGSLWVVHPTTQHVPRKVAAFRDFLIGALKARPLGSSR